MTQFMLNWHLRFYRLILWEHLRQGIKFYFIVHTTKNYLLQWG